MNEIVELRGRHHKVFELGGGRYRLETGNHPHTFKNNLWLPVDTTVETESGTDADVGLNYIARSRFEALDYDIKFGKNDPVWMKIKHIPTNKKITFKPRQNNNNPDHVIAGNKISVSQAWDGIDMEIYVTNRGTKTNYIITSAAGQRVIEFDVNGDVGGFRVSTPWYKRNDTGLPDGHPLIPTIYVPVAFSSGRLSYDFRQVPVGTVVDPSVTAEIEDGTDGYIRHNPASTSWADCRNATTSSSAPAIDGPQPCLGTYNDYNGGSPYIDRGFLRFDTSSIPAGSTVSAATYDISLNQAVLGDAESGWAFCKASWVAPMTAAQFGDLNFANVTAKDRRAAVANNIVGDFTDLTFVVAEGITPLAIRNYHDYGNSQPSSFSYFNFLGSGFGEAPLRPHITVEYAPAVALDEMIRRVSGGRGAAGIVRSSTSGPTRRGARP